MAVQYENVQWDRDYLLTFKNPEDGTIIQVDSLRVQFDIEMYVDNKEKTNKGTVSISNLSDDTLKKINTRYGTLTLTAGYKGNIKNIVTGDVINIRTTKQGADRITTFELAPNFTNLAIKKVNYSFPVDIYLENVLAEIAKQLDLAFSKSDKGEWRKLKCQFGYPAYGTGKQVLDEIASTYAIEWKIVDNELIVTDRYSLNGGEQEKAIVLSKDSGLLDIPYIDSEEVSKATGQALDKENEQFIPPTKVLKPKKDGTPRKVSRFKARRYGIRVKALLNPEIRPNGLFKVVTDDDMFNSFYRVRSVNFKGDSRGGEWYMELWGDSVDADELD